MKSVPSAVADGVFMLYLAQYNFDSNSHMKIFLSWSGTSSRMVAEALNDWLPRVIQAVKPFLSSNIDKGAQWSSEIDKALDGTSFGIICLTPDNLESPWIHYEVGALSKQANDSVIWTFLLEVKPANVNQPLGRFQHTIAQKDEVLKLLYSVNSKIAEPLRDSLLEETFNDLWPRLSEKLANAATGINAVQEKPVMNENGVRDQNDKLNEILEFLRNQKRGMETPELLPVASLAARAMDFVEVDFIVSNPSSNFTRAEIVGHLVRFFPTGKVNVEKRDDMTFFIAAKLSQPLNIGLIHDYLRILEASSGGRLETLNFFTSSGAHERYENLAELKNRIVGQMLGNRL